MPNRESSDQVAAIAARVLARKDPIDNLLVDTLIEAIALANSGEAARAVVRKTFQPFLDEARTLAGSVVSQADGKE